jgi:hypothetical protein
MQRALNNTTEQEVFSMWFAYIHCWTTDVFFTGPPRIYISSPVINLKSVSQSVTCVEAGSNTSTVTLRVVAGDEKESLESETVKYGHESYGTRTRK